ncbi:hypothetical protein B0T16DRAFT_415522 [Cercophora newfieldiana]|uniref:Secreted protein n=1 Tax=Cercophora newfieldiana TaxID=92897 RepID=A0AA39XZL1_9PEZI|nr:hypothetical protein B0T16DRAFT_415522 [Cercophora newfieldiana]
MNLILLVDLLGPLNSGNCCMKKSSFLACLDSSHAVQATYPSQLRVTQIPRNPSHHLILGCENCDQQPLHLLPKVLIRLPILRDIEVQRAPCAETEGDDACRQYAERASLSGFRLPSGGFVCGAVTEDIQHCRSLAHNKN